MLIIPIKFFESIIGEDLRKFILGRKYSLMVLAACGAVVNNSTSLKQLRQVVRRYARLTTSSLIV